MSDTVYNDALENEPYGAHHYPYVKIWAILVGLLIISVVGPMLEIPVLTLVTAFGIAIVKAYLVVRFFMHLVVEKKYVLYMLGTMLLFMFLLFSALAPDIMNHSGSNWENVAAQEHVKDVFIQAREGELDKHHAPGGGHAEGHTSHSAAAEAAHH